VQIAAIITNARRGRVALSETDFHKTVKCLPPKKRGGSGTHNTGSPLYFKSRGLVPLSTHGYMRPCVGRRSRGDKFHLSDSPFFRAQFCCQRIKSDSIRHSFHLIVELFIVVPTKNSCGLLSTVSRGNVLH